MELEREIGWKRGIVGERGREECREGGGESVSDGEKGRKILHRELIKDHGNSLS